MRRFTVTIVDHKWPKLTMIVNTEQISSTPGAITQEYQYDIAYNQFENTLHNILRKAVEEETKQHKQQQGR